MLPKSMTTVLLMAVVLVGPGIAVAETAAESFAQGEALLAKGQFPVALQSFAAAARDDRNNQEYMQHFAMVRRVVDLRSRLETEQNLVRWESMAKALRAFYVSERIYSELLMLDQKLHSRLGTGDTAAMLAETQLAMSRTADAVKTLSALEDSKATAMTQALLGIALVRCDRADEAKKIATKLELPAEAGPNLLYAAAQLHAGTGDSAKALKLLQTCFEATLPSILDGFKSHAKACPEFAAMAASPEFVAVLATKSKMPESKCSGGSSCAGCPMAGKCPHSQGKAQ
jgi:hypothetical protein